VEISRILAGRPILALIIGSGSMTLVPGLLFLVAYFALRRWGHKLSRAVR
jgi:hypothetical protein